MGHVKGRDVIGELKSLKWVTGRRLNWEGRLRLAVSVLSVAVVLASLSTPSAAHRLPYNSLTHSIEAFSYIPHLDRDNLSRDHVSDKSHFHAVAIKSNP